MNERVGVDNFSFVPLLILIADEILGYQELYNVEYFEVSVYVGVHLAGKQVFIIEFFLSQLCNRVVYDARWQDLNNKMNLVDHH